MLTMLFVTEIFSLNEGLLLLSTLNSLYVIIELRNHEMSAMRMQWECNAEKHFKIPKRFGASK